MGSRSRTAFAGTATNTTLSAANLNNGPGGLIAAGITTSDTTGVTTVADITGATTGAFTPGASRDLMIMFRVLAQNSNSGEKCQIKIQKDGSDLSRFDFVQGDANTDSHHVGYFIDVSPTSASHTYKLQGGRSGAGTGTFQFSTGSHIHVFDIGATF